MKDFFLADCAQHENKVLTSSFVVVSKQVKSKKTGEPYLALTLGDRTGQVEAKMWDNVEDALDVFEQDDFIKIKGLLNKYKNRFQITIHKLRRLGDSEVDFADYLPKTTKDIGELWQTLAGFVANFQDPCLKALVEAFMSDPDIAEAYRTAPAAKTLHHAYIGGLFHQLDSIFLSCRLICRNDSKMESMRAHFAREVCSEGVWTGYNPSLARPLLNTAKFLEKKPAAEAASVEASGTQAAATMTESSEPAVNTDSMAAAAGPEKI